MLTEEERREYQEWAERCAQVAPAIKYLSNFGEDGEYLRQSAILCEQVAERVPKMLEEIEALREEAARDNPGEEA